MRQKPCADIQLGVLPAYRDKGENTDFSCATEEVALQGTCLENNCMRRCMQNRRALAARKCSIAPAKGYAKSMPRPKFKTSRFLFPVPRCSGNRQRWADMCLFSPTARHAQKEQRSRPPGSGCSQQLRRVTQRAFKAPAAAPGTKSHPECWGCRSAASLNGLCPHHSRR